MTKLQSDFASRDELVAYVTALAPWATGEAAPTRGGRQPAQAALQAIDPINYGATRNFGSGKVTRLSPYVHHGIVDLNTIRNYALSRCSQPQQASKFIQELAWRDFWQRLAERHPDWLWYDVEDYKTGWATGDYHQQLPADIADGSTGVACIDAFIADLLNSGYVHNHARMYLASYVVHFRRVRWQAGAQWFLQHLLDGDEASNNLSWQWVTSTFSNKPYIFNLANVSKYFGAIVDVTPANNTPLDASYAELSARLFPNLEGERG